MPSVGKACQLIEGGDLSHRLGTAYFAYGGLCTEAQACARIEADQV